jgi:hypothetical protein
MYDIHINGGVRYRELSGIKYVEGFKVLIGSRLTNRMPDFETDIYEVEFFPFICVCVHVYPLAVGTQIGSNVNIVMYIYMLLYISPLAVGI